MKFSRWYYEEAAKIRADLIAVRGRLRGDLSEEYKAKILEEKTALERALELLSAEDIERNPPPPPREKTPAQIARLKKLREAAKKARARKKLLPAARLFLKPYERGYDAP